MAFLGNIGKKVGEAAQAAAKKSSELVEITKLNVNIGQEEDKIQKLYAQIGKAVYAKYPEAGTIDEEYVEACKQIVVHESNIKALKEKISEIKNVKTCSNCGAEMEKTQLFCSKCGTKNETGAEPQQSTDSSESAVTCSSCGATLPSDSLFCTNCGNKLQ